MKKLYKSKDNKIISGVVGGLGEYFGVDPVILRVLWIIITAVSGFFPGIIAYILMSAVVPEESEDKK